MRTRVIFAALCVLECQGGLFVDKGNSYPCNFAAPEGSRDSVCAPGEVCGVDNLCRAFRYEGPQFEADKDGAPIPAFADAGVQLHPGLLSEPILMLTHRGTRNHTVVDKATLLMGDPDSPTIASVTGGADISVNTQPFDAGVDHIFSFAQPGDWFADVVFHLLPPPPDTETDIIIPQPNLPLTSTPLSLGTKAVGNGTRLRSGIDSAVLLRVGTNLMTTAGEFFGTGPDAGRYFPLDIDAGALDGSDFHPLEVRYVPGTTSADVLMLGVDGFYLRRVMGRMVRISADDVVLPPLTAVSSPTMRHDVSGAIWAFTRTSFAPDPAWHALSTWRLDRSGTAGIARLWNDCTPCRAGRMLAFVPLLDGAPEVQVICSTRSSTGPDTLSLVRVVGSAAIDETEECLVEPAEAPFALSQLAFVPPRFVPPGSDAGTVLVQDDANGGGVLLGGNRGQIWSGDSLTGALPLYLERTPLGFGTFSTPDGGVIPVALTDRYLALPRVAGLGFEVLDIHDSTDVALAEDVVVSAMMGQAAGWGVLTSGDVIYVAPPGTGGHFQLHFGPRLVDARGAAARTPFFAEAAVDTSPQHNAVSFVMTADDSVYFAPAPSLDALTDTQDVLSEVTPQLTPAPGSPIRSMTLERSAVGTDGINKVRGYLVAGQQLFIFTFDGAPPRWAATPIPLQGGEPVEVWMDNPLGGLGRVGYRDGEVFTLPGGFLLVNALPKGDAGAPRVLDYENLGGWPVAMTSIGLFHAQWPKVGAHLQNRFEDGGEGKAMDWEEVTLPDGSRPWLGKNARLQVVETGPNGAHVFHLLVFTDDQVLEVGTLSRK